MGKLRRLKKLRRAMRGTYSLSASLRDQMEWEERQHAARAASQEKFFLQAAEKMIQLGEERAAEHFRVGMRVSGPPEAFGLPASTESGKTFGLVVTDVDQERGTITFSTAAP